MSSKSARPAGENKKQQQQQQQQQQQKNGGSAKKQAIPSQKRADHEKQQQHLQQAGQQKQQAAQKQSGKRTGTGQLQPNEQQQQQRQLDTTVTKLVDKNESCREQVRANMEAFSKKGSEIKAEISRALEQQVRVLEDQESVSSNVEELRRRMLELSGGPLLDEPAADETQPIAANDASQKQAEEASEVPCDKADISQIESAGSAEIATSSSSGQVNTASNSKSEAPVGDKEQNKILKAHNGIAERVSSTVPAPAPVAANCELDTDDDVDKLMSNSDFEPLTARLDPKTKFITLKASLERHFVKAPELLEPICNRLLMLSRKIDALVQANDQSASEIAKLTLIKSKLGDLCRELQRSNNQIRIESLSMIKGEQQKAKEQAGKIQATLAGVMKLFDENQQRNLALKQENVDLQAKLKALLDHCGHWEQCVETALKQRDIENCLVKTELTRLNLLRKEEQERFLKEKQDLLRMVEIMRAHQGRIEDKEAKLREDLASYASKYDECQEIIQKGLGKFQVESKRMLKQIEKSRQDYITLLNKYESSNKKIKELLEEKQTWVKSMSQANKKVDTLERLCRSLKQENDRLAGKSTGVGAGAAGDSDASGANPALAPVSAECASSAQKVALEVDGDNTQGREENSAS